ncbi:MAG: bifunctional serine/threonine-protein kinase/ABC transporter substrate-binding protein [Egibacteraceae bacterium]
MRTWSGEVMRRVRRNPLRLEIAGFTNVVEVCAGGFSTVYRADQPRFGRTVAVKVLHVRGLTSSFERECEALGMLGSHPNVVSVFDADIDKSGRPYIVMEHLPAGSLADRLEAEGKLPWEEVLALGVRLAGALQSAHNAGLLHLDVKPANVLVGQDGEPKVADFGIARLRGGLGGTTAQMLACTAGYAGPERFEEGEPTEASDVYGLGATLFTLLAGHSPFLRSSDEEPNVEVVIGRMLFGPVPELDAKLPEGLRAAVRQAIARKAAHRYGSVTEFGAALQAVQRDHGLAVTPSLVVPVAHVPPPLRSPPVRNRRLAKVSSLLVTALLAGVGGVVAGPDTACSLAKTVKADGVLSLGTLLPRTGSFVYTGPALEAGVNLAIDDITAAGGIPGIAMKLDEANRRDEGNPSADTASQSTDALLSGEVDVIIGAGTSAATFKVIDKVVCAGVMLFSPSNGAAVFSTYPDHGLYFRAVSSNLLRGRVLGSLVVRDGNSTAVVMARHDPSGDTLRQATAKAIQDSGGRVLDSFSYDPEAPRHDGDLQRIRAKNPDAIVLIGLNETAPILAAMIEQGLGPQDKKVYGGGSTSNTLALQVSPRNPSVLAGMRGVRADPGSDAFVRRVKEVNPGLRDVTYAAEAYDAVVVTALAAALAGTDAPAAIAERVDSVTKGGEKCVDFAACMTLVGERKDIDYDGASGPLELTDAGEPSSGTYLISEFQADGSLAPLRTEAVSF